MKSKFSYPYRRDSVTGLTTATAPCDIPQPGLLHGRVSGSIYFLGKYRPAHFEADSLDQCAAKMYRATAYLADLELFHWIANRMQEGMRAIRDEHCGAWSTDHCDRGVSFAKRPHDPFLDRVTSDMPACPGLDYSGACNVPA